MCEHVCASAAVVISGDGGATCFEILKIIPKSNPNPSASRISYVPFPHRRIGRNLAASVVNAIYKGVCSTSYYTFFFCYLRYSVHLSDIYKQCACDWLLNGEQHPISLPPSSLLRRPRRLFSRADQFALNETQESEQKSCARPTHAPAYCVCDRICVLG